VVKGSFIFFTDVGCAGISVLIESFLMGSLAWYTWFGIRVCLPDLFLWEDPLYGTRHRTDYRWTGRCRAQDVRNPKDAFRWRRKSGAVGWSVTRISATLSFQPAIGNSPVPRLIGCAKDTAYTLQQWSLMRTGNPISDTIPWILFLRNLYRPIQWKQKWRSCTPSSTSSKPT
jgi:hypothetical protein